jgi:hypothetical protein
VKVGKPRHVAVVAGSFSDAIMERGPVVTEPEAVTTGSYTQPAIDGFAG